VDNIIAARKDGPFLDLFDFCARVDVRKVNKRALEALVRSGALDTIGPQVDVDYDRAVLWAALSEAVKTAEQHHANKNAGMTDLFGQVETVTQGNADVYADYAQQKRWSIKERLNGERDTLGLYLTGHPIDEYDQELTHLVSSRLSHLKPEKAKQTVAGLVVAFRVMKTKKGDNMGFVTLDDRTGRLEVAVFADIYAAHREKLVKDALLVIEGQVSNDDFSGGLKMRADAVYPLAEARETKVSALRLRLRPGTVTSLQGDELKQCLQRHTPGACKVVVDYQLPRVQGDVSLGDAWRVRPSDELLAHLRSLYGTDAVTLVYGGREGLTALH
jgi:DNA polymerase-3 subunit alpha